MSQQLEMIWIWPAFINWPLAYGPVRATHINHVRQGTHWVLGLNTADRGFLSVYFNNAAGKRTLAVEIQLQSRGYGHPFDFSLLLFTKTRVAGLGEKTRYS